MTAGLTAADHRTIARLTDECDLLRERIRQLEDILGVRSKAPRLLQLTPAEAALFGHLMARELVTAEGAVTAMYSHDIGEAPDKKIVDVYVCKIRKKVKPFGIEIKTVWGQGYRIPIPSKAIVRKMLEEDRSS